MVQLTFTCGCDDSRAFSTVYLSKSMQYHTKQLIRDGQWTVQTVQNSKIFFRTTKKITFQNTFKTIYNLWLE